MVVSKACNQGRNHGITLGWFHYRLSIAMACVWRTRSMDDFSHWILYILPVCHRTQFMDADSWPPARLHFRPATTFDYIMMTFLLFPTGICWFLFLDLVDILFVVCVEVPLFLFCGIRQEDADAIKKKEKVFSTLGLTYAEVEGYLQQKAIATLFFESIPQLVVQMNTVQVADRSRGAQSEIRLLCCSWDLRWNQTNLRLVGLSQAWQFLSDWFHGSSIQVISNFKIDEEQFWLWNFAWGSSFNVFYSFWILYYSYIRFWSFKMLW